MHVKIEMNIKMKIMKSDTFSRHGLGATSALEEGSAETAQVSMKLKHVVARCRISAPHADLEIQEAC